MAAIALLVVVLGAAPARAANGWRAPTGGVVTRAFDLGPEPFAGGQHRGADFAAAPGSPVRAACAGRVVVAARIGSSGGVVTIACGAWRVSHLPLARIDARAGGRVAMGDPIGTAARARTHAGIHLGVRRSGDRFGYVDPLRFIRPAHAPPPAGPAGRARRGARRARPTIATPRPAPVAASRPTPLIAPRPLAPWPAWAGLTALLVAVAGGGAGIRGAARRRSHAVRTRRVAVPRARTAQARHDLPP